MKSPQTSAFGWRVVLALVALLFGGLAEVAPAGRRGFGSKLLEVSLRPQGGKVEPLFDPAGFQANIQFPAAPAAH